MPVLAVKLALLVVLAKGMCEAYGVIRRNERWDLHGLARLPGAVLISRQPIGAIVAGLFIIGCAAYFFDIVPIAGAVVMATTFLLVVSLEHSAEDMGYFVSGRDGTRLRRVFHHLHLAGLMAVATVVAEIATSITRADHLRLVNVNRLSDAYFIYCVSACIAAHYFTAGVSKVKARGLSWGDHQMLPFYIQVFDAWRLGDTGSLGRTAEARCILKHPRIGYVAVRSTLFMELLSPVFLVAPWPRYAVGISLLVFHIATARILRIPFWENFTLVAACTLSSAVVVADPCPGIGNSINPVYLITSILFVGIVMASMALDDRLFPLSSLDMFTPEPAPCYAVLIRTHRGRVVPSGEVVGVGTRSLSHDYEMYPTGNKKAFVQKLQRRMAQRVQGYRQGDYIVSVIEIRIDRSEDGPHGRLVLTEATIS